MGTSGAAPKHPTGGGGGARQCGFTLIELMTVMTIVIVLAVLAAPSFNDAILSNKLTSFANSFIASSQLARSEAIKRNATVTVCRSANGTSCATSGTWQQGWIVFQDANANGSIDGSETLIQYQGALSSDYHFTEASSTYTLAFQSVGAGATAATLTLCRALPSPGSQERQIVVTATGRTSVSTTRTGTCT